MNNQTQQVLMICGGWGLCLCLIVIVCRRSQRSVGLPIAYGIIFTIMHAGAIIYAIPTYHPELDPYLAQVGVNAFDVINGFQLSLLGLFGFLMGISCYQFLLHRSRPPDSYDVGRNVEKFTWYLICLGAIFFFLLLPIAHRIPSGQAICSAGVHLVTVGIAFRCLLAVMKPGFQAKLSALLQTMSIPMVTILVLGFLGYAVSAVVEIVCFLGQFIRIRWRYSLFLLPVVYFLASVYITYMQARGGIRESVWGRDNLDNQIVTIARSFTTDFEWFNPSENRHLYLIDNRLNQNYLVGRSMRYIGDGHASFANGETIAFAAVAWIPRALWPGKPEVGGSGNTVARYTGMMFNKNTSVGVGQVLEFYLNFGTIGVFVGFMVLGIILRHVDMTAAGHLKSGNLGYYAAYHLVGICMLQPQGILSEIVASSVAAWGLAYGLERLVFSKMFTLNRGHSTKAAAS